MDENTWGNTAGWGYGNNVWNEPTGGRESLIHIVIIYYYVCTYVHPS